MLNLSELEQFVTFAEQGTLSGAAQTLHISQPTLTRTMKHVEAAFGVPLFRRSRRRATGALLSRPAPHDCRGILCTCAAVVSAAGSVRLISGANGFLPAVSARFHCRACSLRPL